MGCLTIAEVFQQGLEGNVSLAGSTVTYYPAVLQGYSTATQSRAPSESAPVNVPGMFGEEEVSASDDAITYATTFVLSAGAYSGTPSPGDRIEDGDISYRVVRVRRQSFGGTFTNYVLTLGN